MKDFQGKRRFRRLLYSKITIVILAALFILFARSVWGLWQKNRLTHERLEENQTAIAALAEREGLLTRQVATLETPHGVEAALRDKFSVVKAGEHVVTIIEPTSTAAEAASGAEVGFWHRLFTTLF